MASAEPPSSSSLLPLLESLEDSTAGQSEQTDAYLTIANRLSGEEGQQFLPAVEKHFSRLGKAILVTEPSCPASFRVFAWYINLHILLYRVRLSFSCFPETFASEILSALCSQVVKSADKNTCTRALWVISKQSFPPDVVSSILGTLESVCSREDIQSVVMEHEALNVVIRMLEQAPAQMGEGALRWAKLVIPLVVHSASKVRLRAAAAMELGMPLLLEKQMEVAGIIEPMMSSKLIPELQKLFMSKNETNVLKLWPLFVKLLGKLLHRGGPFINSLLHLEELGFRSSSPTIKKIAFIAWKSLIDNFALNPAILCSAKRVKLLMQPLASINVRTEALMLTKVEVWWYLVVQLGPNLSPIFDQVRHTSTFTHPPANTSRMSLNSSVQIPSTFPSIQLLGLEMLLHYFLGPEVLATAAKKKLTLSLGKNRKPLNHPLLSGASAFTKHAAVLTSNVRDGFTNIGKDAPGSKKDRQGSEVLTLMLQALQSIVTSEALPADKVLILFEATVKGIPQRVLGSASYQVGKMDVLNGTPALFLILLLYNSNMLSAYIEDERWFYTSCDFINMRSVIIGKAANCRVMCALNELNILNHYFCLFFSFFFLQSNEVNQGDALEHNFSAMHSALLFPITHLLNGTPLQQAPQKSMLSSWSKLYKVFARCSALVVTAEENICCEELCAKMAAAIDKDALMVPSTLHAVASILQVIVECVDFSPYTPQFQQKLKSPHTPVNWMKKRNKVLGNLSTFQSLLVQCLEVYLEGPEASSDATGLALVSILSALFTNLSLANTVKEALRSLIQPLTLFYKQAASEPPKFFSQLLGKLEKLLCEILGCLQTRSTLPYNDELLALLSPLLCVSFPHKNKHLRTSVAQFWNSTFGNSVTLTYPDEIRPILSQVKQKTPIILPGFEVVGVSDDLSGPYSSESSQLETNLSGMPVSSVGKRDSLLGKAAEMKDRSSGKTSKPVSTKLDFGSPKPPCRGVLEEEASIDFVFIPPETKERVLTEHQKEVKRTKRVDIPAMYNNLDASLDTTAFTQYTQSQEDSFPKAVENMPETHKPEEMIPESADVSIEDDVKSDDKAEYLDMQSKEGTSPNISGSSDLVSGTPQKPNSRRQSFITLEKYAEGKPASPSSVSTFTRLIKTSNSQECSKTNKNSSSQASLTSTGPNSQDSQSSRTGKTDSQCPVNDALESPVRPKDSVTKSGPVRLIERLPSDPTEDEDVIPDTQTEVEDKEGTQMASLSEQMKPSSQDEESGPTLDDSQSSGTSPGEPRRSGRYRVRPLLPGEDPEEREEKYTPLKRRRSGEESKSDSPKPSSTQNRPNTRGKQAAEEDKQTEKDGDKPRKDSQIVTTYTPQIDDQSQELIEKTNKEKRDSQIVTSPTNDKSQDRTSTTNKLVNDSEVKDKLKTSEITDDNLSQEDSQGITPSSSDSQSRRRSRRSKAVESEDKSENKNSLERQTRSNSQLALSAVGQSEASIGGRTRRSKVQEEQSKSSPSSTPESSQSLDTAGSINSSRGRGKYPRRRSSQVLASKESSESESLEAKESPPMPKKRGRKPRASLPSPLTLESGNKINNDIVIVSDSQSIEAKTDLEDSQESQDSQCSELLQVTHNVEEQSNAESPMKVTVDAVVEKTETDNTKNSESLSVSPHNEQTQKESNIDNASSQEADTKDMPSAEMIESVAISTEPTRQELPCDPVSVLSAVDTVAPPDEPTEKLQSSESSQENVEKLQASGSSQENVEKLQVSGSSQENVEKLQVSGSSQENVEKLQASESSQENVEKLQVSGSSQENDVEASEPVDNVTEKQDDLNSNQEHPVVPVEDTAEDIHSTTLGQNQMECPDVIDPFSKEEKQSASNEQGESTNQPTETSAGEDITPLQESDKDRNTQIVECQDEEETQTANTENDVVANLDAAPDGVCNASALSESTNNDVFLDSPAKQKDLEALMGAEGGQSPSSGRNRGTWSPSASPSTSILKKGLKRQLEEESPSNLVKSRRVSFADPIQHQELADDIDRRSPAIRTSSPRRSKYVTTPTKGLLILSPRNLHSPGYKSSKKCLISEMSQEQRPPVSKDCIYPALVGCSTPVEAVLPQISSNMWSRGFGQLVRARNIKTVGDLSALTPSEIKTLPIRSPKISNVKKALKNYEQQRKGRGGDELKSLDEMEMTTSELETSAPQNLDEEDKTSGETLGVPELDGLGNQTPDTPAGEQRPGGQLHPEELLSDVEALTDRMTHVELSRCSPRQLVQIHDQLGGMMRRLVVELQTRLCQTDGKP
uniref:Replication timing regulatory factor 1 n=1 Tax=Sander lucioperca TaxID=283035 RepID=A0A8D0AB96_SANLU